MFFFKRTYKIKTFVKINQFNVYLFLFIFPLQVLLVKHKCAYLLKQNKLFCAESF